MSRSASEELPLRPANIALLTAPPLVGIMLNWFFYGVLCVQTYIYSRYFNDKKWTKILVYGLVLLETAQTALVTNDGFRWFVYGFGDVTTLSKPFTSFIDSPIIGGFVALIVQLFFSRRIWILTKSKVLAGAIGLVSVVQFVGALVGGIRAIQINDVIKMQSSTVLVGMWFAGSALSDTLIAISMIILLLRNNSPAFRGVDALRRIVMLIVETNAMTAATAIVGLIVWKVLPDASLFMAPACAIGKLYSNTLLVVLNNRLLLRKAGVSLQEDDGSHGGFGHRKASNRSTPHHLSNKDGVIIIDVATQTDNNSDNNLPLGRRKNNTSQYNDRAFQSI